MSKIFKIIIDLLLKNNKKITEPPIIEYKVGDFVRIKKEIEHILAGSPVLFRISEVGCQRYILHGVGSCTKWCYRFRKEELILCNRICPKYLNNNL